MAANPNDPRTQRLKFREILARPGVTVMPGGFSPLYAEMCEQIGFECYFVAGSQMSAFLLGVPDNGIIVRQRQPQIARYLILRGHVGEEMLIRVSRLVDQLVQP